MKKQLIHDAYRRADARDEGLFAHVMDGSLCGRDRLVAIVTGGPFSGGRRLRLILSALRRGRPTFCAESGILRSCLLDALYKHDIARIDEAHIHRSTTTTFPSQL
jgi:hypothetical protein